MKTVHDNLEFLKKISKIKSCEERNLLLENASTEEILTILECTINILKFRVRLNNTQKNRLKKHAMFLRDLSRKRSEKSVRKLIQQGEGGFLPALLIPIITQAVASIIAKNG